LVFEKNGRYTFALGRKLHSTKQPLQALEAEVRTIYGLTDTEYAPIAMLRKAIA